MQEELKRIGQQFKAMQLGEAWHGKSLREALVNLSPEDAAKAPFKGAHSIWQYMLHISAWRTFAMEKLAGNEDFSIEIGGDIDWPSIGEVTQENWEEAYRSFEKNGQELRNLLRTKTDEQLWEKVSGKPYSFYFLLHGIVQHDAYHCGQIVLTRKMLEQIQD